MFSAVCLWILAAPPLVTEIPEGTDVALRVAYGELRESGLTAWDDLGPLLKVRPGLAPAAARLEKSWTRRITDLARATGADLEASSLRVTLLLDLDAKGGVVAAAVLRGAFAKTEPEPVIDPADGRSFEIDGHTAYRGPKFSWSVVEVSKERLLVVGNERGVQRQVRHIKGGKKPSKGGNGIVTLAGRLRRDEPVVGAVALTPAVAKELGAPLSDYGKFVALLSGLTITATAKGFTAHLVSSNERDRAAVAHGARSFVAAMRGGAALLLAGAELLAGLDMASQKSALLPKQLDVDLIEPMIADWLEELTFEARLRKRPNSTTEMAVTLSDYRALLLLGLVLFAVDGGTDDSIQSEVRALLMTLRRAQLLHREVNGAFVPCSATPPAIPQGPVPWPPSSCFSKLAFAPKRPVRVQIEAAVEDGKLLLVARADPDGDGVPQVWYLDESAADIRGFGDGAQKED